MRPHEMSKTKNRTRAYRPVRTSGGLREIPESRVQSSKTGFPNSVFAEFPQTACPGRWRYISRGCVGVKQVKKGYFKAFASLIHPLAPEMERAVAINRDPGYYLRVSFNCRIAQGPICDGRHQPFSPGLGLGTGWREAQPGRCHEAGTGRMPAAGAGQVSPTRQMRHFPAPSICWDGCR